MLCVGATGSVLEVRVHWLLPFVDVVLTRETVDY